jgi:pimeloyl-ACP methyl ester carboxylesterase
LGLIGAGARLRVAPELLENAASPATFYSAVNTIVGWSFGSQTPEQLTELAAKRMAETRPSVLHGDFMACDAFDEMQRIGEIEQPTLVICGADDKMTPARYAQFLADNIPNAISKIIPGAGHMVMLEKPQATAAILCEFLTGISY